MALNLSRNSRLWVSTVDSEAGGANDTSFTNANTFEIPLQEGYTLSQSTGSEDITVEEAGPTPVRGSRRFNTQLDPVEWNFSTYISPYLSDHDVDGGTTPEIHLVTDALLWHAIANGRGTAVDLDNTSTTSTVFGDASKFDVKFTNNSHHVLTELFLYFKIDNEVFKVKKAQINQAEISIDIADISQVAWTGQGTELIKLAPADVPSFISAAGSSFDVAGGTTESFVQIPAVKQYLLNKLTTMSLVSDVAPGFDGDLGILSVGTNGFYNIALTSGTITINNNITFVTPSTLSEVDTPIGSFTGSFEVTGTIDSYLKDGTGLNDGTVGNEYGSLELLEHMLLKKSQVVTASNITMDIGSSVAPTCKVLMPNVQISIPTVNVDAVVSQSFEFKAMPRTADMNDGQEISLEIKAA